MTKQNKKSFKIGTFFFLILVLLMSFGIVYAQTIVIDSFDAGSQELVVLTGGAAAGNGIFVAPGTSFGNARKIFAADQAGSGSISISADKAYEDPPGNPLTTDELQFSSDSGTIGRGYVVWDGTDTFSIAAPINVNTLNLSLAGNGTPADNTGFLISVTGTDNLALLEFRAYLAGDVDAFGQRVFPLHVTDRLDLFFQFSEFTQAGSNTWTPANFANVGALELEIDGTVQQQLDLSIDNIDALPDAREYGDLNIKYGAVLDGYHIPQGLTLGVNLDAESTANPSPNADGDNINDFDDEDGVVPFSPHNWPIASGGSAFLQYTVRGCISAPCYLNGWIDWNNDGTFNPGDGDVVIADQTVSNGTLVIQSITVPSGVEQGWKYARFRLCPMTGAGGCNDPAATAVVNGEVEDYVWYVGGTPTAVNLQSFMAGSNNNMVVYVTIAFAALMMVGLVALVLRRERNKA